jgi:hypothetical protein
MRTSIDQPEIVTSHQPVPDIATPRRTDAPMPSFHDGRRVFADPVAYLRSLGLEAVLVAEVVLTAAA